MAAALQLDLVPTSEARMPVETADVHVGGILWIRRKNSIDTELTHCLNLDTNAFNHPAVVIRSKKQEMEGTLVTIAPVSKTITTHMPLQRWPDLTKPYFTDDIFRISRADCEPP
jgi:hypothetical protein